MPVKVKELVEFLECFAPLKLAEKWDNAGLLLGDPDNSVQKIMLSLDVTPDVAEQAIKNKVELIISHHPLIFDGIKNLAQTNWKNRMLALLLKNNIAVYCAHTNLDIANGGVNDILANRLGLQNISVLQKSGQDKLFKIVVFVPEKNCKQVMFAMTGKGAGHIGKYSDCTFQTKGVGTFRPLSGSNPFIGTQGDLQSVNEVRLETIVPDGIKSAVLTAMLAAHPYEEVAYDVYELQNNFNSWGIGRIGDLPKKLTVRQFSLLVRQALSLDYVVCADAGNKIKRVAVVGGAGADFVKAALAMGADALVTGDVKYHSAQEASFSGLTIIDAGHQGTEWPVLDVLQEHLAQFSAGKKLKIIIAEEKNILQQL